MSAGYSYRDCAAGVGIDAQGKSFEQVCEQAALALFGLEAHLATVLPERGFELEFAAIDPVVDARAWLERLLAHARLADLVLCAARLTRAGDRWRGEAWGMPWRGGGRARVRGLEARDFTLRRDGKRWHLHCVALLEQPLRPA
jgi:SHS2 domain-containing protein